MNGLSRKSLIFTKMYLINIFIFRGPEDRAFLPTRHITSHQDAAYAGAVKVPLAIQSNQAGNQSVGI